MNYLPDISYPSGGMIRETKLSVHHRQMSSKSNSGGGLFFFYGFDTKFGMGIFLHVSALPQGQTTYPSTGETSSLCALHNCGFPAPLCSPYWAVSLLSLQCCSIACKMDLRRDRLVQLICSSFFVPVSFEFGRAVWLRFHPSAYPPCPHPSFMAHLGGVMVGITLGVVILRNYEQRLQDQTLWWIFLSIYLIFVLFAIFWNIFAYSLLDLKLPPPPWMHGTETSGEQKSSAS